MSFILSAVAIKKYVYVNTIVVSILKYIRLELSIIYNGILLSVQVTIYQIVFFHQMEEIFR
ncbi:unnamed protein product [Debaryomyces tyrocola]|nr:unnamed protein product [Debaryomyces tyrocola]